MALKPVVEERLALDSYFWCGHALAPDFKLVRCRGAFGGVGGESSSCDECRALSVRVRRCDECGARCCDDCAAFSFAGFVASDSFVCYRCHPTDLARAGAKLRRSGSSSCSSTATPQRSSTRGPRVDAAGASGR